jgi:general secretion pathway protein G
LPYASVAPAPLDYHTPELKSRRFIPDYIQWVIFASLVGLFVLVIVPNSRGRTSHPIRTKAIADISGMKTALGLFEIQNNRFPTTSEDLQALVVNPENLEKWERTMDKIPIDPWLHPYIYCSPGKTGAAFDLLSAGPDGKEGTADDIALNSK